MNFKMRYDSIKLWYQLDAIPKDAVRLYCLLGNITGEEYEDIIGEKWQMCSDEIIAQFRMEFVNTTKKYISRRKKLEA